MRNIIRRLPLPRDRGGVALPLSLLGIIFASILVSGMLVTSSMEAALSVAHQDATSRLYRTAGALESYVAGLGASLVPIKNAEYTPPGGGPIARIDVDQLSSVPSERVPGAFDAVFTVKAEPVGGGRAVSAMVMVRPFSLDIESAATFGGNSKIGGSTIVSDGSDGTSCNLATAEDAIVHGEGTTVDTVGGNVAIKGSVTESDLKGEELIRQTLGGMTIEGLLRQLETLGLTEDKYIKFGTNKIWGTKPVYKGTGNDKPNSLATKLTRKSNTDPYNWYCPGRMDTQNDCWKVPTELLADTVSQKIIAIDAGGGEVTIQGDHGQGMLIVVNGGLRISGGFIFRGIIVSTHDIDISGTGNKVEGAIVSQNEVRVDRPSDTDSEVLGNAVVRFNRCAINSVMGAVNPGGSLRVAGRTVGWSELVR